MYATSHAHLKFLKLIHKLGRLLGRRTCESGCWRSMGSHRIACAADTPSGECRHQYRTPTSAENGLRR